MNKVLSPILPAIRRTVDAIQSIEISEERQQLLQPLIDYIQTKTDAAKTAQLNFICTHNSRRSQLAQVWAQIAAHYYNIEVSCFSGGVEITACNARTIAILVKDGCFVRLVEPGTNPLYEAFYSKSAEPLKLFSKVYDNPLNPSEDFAAVMTCSHADENCPFIPGAAQRISLQYEDPKAFDDTPQEAEHYEERSHQIAAELFYVFANIKS
tara:strand:+ start:1245 stop:1874 length:630 start_codon:yes stop_codon:yes gene_type:complete